jgi:hypothetical protein
MALPNERTVMFSLAEIAQAVHDELDVSAHFRIVPGTLAQYVTVDGGAVEVHRTGDEYLIVGMVPTPPQYPSHLDPIEVAYPASMSMATLVVGVEMMLERCA